MISRQTVCGVWVFGRLMLIPRMAWAARSVAFRGQWTLAELIGAAVVVGILAALLAFVFWPGPRS